MDQSPISSVSTPPAPYTIDQFEDHVDQLFLGFFEAMRFSSTVKSYPLPEDSDPDHAKKILDIFKTSYCSLNNLHSAHESEEELNKEIRDLNEKIKQKKQDIITKKKKMVEIKKSVEEKVLQELTDENLGLY